MGSIADAFASFLRDYVVEGVPASGPNRPRKSEGRAIGVMLEAAISNAALGSLLDVVKTTKANLDADLAHPASSVAMVYADATDANNDLYVKSGASGTGSWNNTGLIHAIIESLAQPYVDAAQAAAAQATAVLASAMLDRGEYTEKATWSPIPGGGAVARGERGLTYVGGAGSGEGSKVRASIQRQPSMLDGEVYTFKFTAARSATFTRGISGDIRINGSIDRTPTAVRTSIATAGQLDVEVDYQLQSGDVSIDADIVTTFVSGVPGTEWFEDATLVVLLKTPLSQRSANSVMLDGILSERLAGYAEKFGLGDILERVSLNRDVQNGAVADGRWAVLFPPGQDGASTSVLVREPIDGASEAGRRVVRHAAFAKSATFTRTVVPLFKVEIDPEAGAVDPGTPATITLVDEDDDLLLYRFEYTVVGDEIGLSPSAQQTNSTNTVAEERLELVGYWADYSTALRPALTPSAEALADFVGDRVLGVPALRVYREIEADDFASLADAMASIPRTSQGFWYRINLGRAVYELTEQLTMRPYVEIVGKGPESIIRLFQPNDTSAADIIANSVIDASVTCVLRSLQIEGKNCQYGIHSDSTGQVFNGVTVFENIRVYHFGNLEAPANTWPGQNAIGAGASGGQRLTLRGCYLWAKNGNAFSCHNNINARHPCRVELYHNVFVTEKDDTPVVIATSIGSRQPDEWHMEGNVLGGRWLHSVQGWVPPEVPDNRVEFTFTCIGNSASVFTNADPGTTGKLVRPIVSDEETIARNSTGAEIPMGAVCVLDGDPNEVRLMTVADDPAVLKPLVAIEAVPIGGARRFKRGGYLPLGNAANVITGESDILRTDTASFAFGDIFSIDPANPGKIMKGGTQGVFTAIRADAVRVDWP